MACISPLYHLTGTCTLSPSPFPLPHPSLRRIEGVLNGAVDLVIIKVFNGPSCGWTYASSLAAAMQECRTRGARIISMSLGGGGGSTTERNTVDTLYNAGILLFAAAGNAGNTATSFPAGYTNVISVAAVDQNNVRASFSQVNSDVELAAPGVAVLSTIPASVAGDEFVLALSSGVNFTATAMIGSVVRPFNGSAVSCAVDNCPPTVGECSGTCVCVCGGGGC
jgi:hypothetical protein